MLTEIPAWIGVASPTTVIIVILLAIFKIISKGDWTPRATTDQIREISDARLADKDQQITNLNSALLIEREINSKLAESVTHLVEGQETTLSLLRALPARPPEGVST